MNKKAKLRKLLQKILDEERVLITKDPKSKYSIFDFQFASTKPDHPENPGIKWIGIEFEKLNEIIIKKVIRIFRP